MTTPAPLSFDIVLATIGRSDVIDRLLDSLEAQRYPGLRLIVVDQNDDDRVAALLDRRGDRLPFVRIVSPPGLSRARNIGLREVSADVVAFADDDCWYPAGLLSRVDELLRANPAWAGVTGRVTDELGRPSAARWSTQAGPIGRGNVWTRGVSISVFLRQAVVQRVGGFDEALGVGSGTAFGSGEETDYLLRALEAGFTLEYEPSVVVGHPQTMVEHTPGTIAAGRSYGMGMGRVLRRHGYPWWTALYHAGRAWGGAGIALVRLKPSEARFLAAVGRGRAAGWLGRGDR